MAKTIFLVRHGESQANVGTHYEDAGASLTEKGREQARFIAQRVLKLTVDVLLSSTMGRARETTEFIAEAIGKEPEFSDLFIERRYPSSLVGLEKKSIEGRELFGTWTDSCLHGGSRVLDGENFDDIKTRALRCLELLQTRQEQNILIVMHGHFMRYLCAAAIYGEALTPEIYAPLHTGLRVNNTGLTVLHFDDDDQHSKWWVSVWNDHAHLG